MHTLFVFNNDPLNPRHPDQDFLSRFQAVKDNAVLISYEQLMFDPDYNPALKNAEGATVVYVGWMLRQEHYQKLADIVTANGGALRTTPAQYQMGMELPRWYRYLRDRNIATPASIWSQGTSAADIEGLVLRAFELGWTRGIVKDYVKSRKHNPEAFLFSNSNPLGTALATFVSQQLQPWGGLVAREWIGIAVDQATDTQQEYRFFVVDRKIVSSGAYWSASSAELADGAVTLATSVAAQLPEHGMFSLDIAKLTNGDYVVIELGDAQVSGLQDCPDWLHALL